MDETEYQRTYHDVNALMCPFEKAMLTNQCGCERLQRVHIADRQGAACNDAGARAQCIHLLQLLRRNAAFALHLTAAGGTPLPHAKEMRVQVGGLMGLQQHLGIEPATAGPAVDNVHALVHRAIARWGTLDALPFSDLMPAIAAYQGRRPASPRR